jgi:hypothetical protein
MDKSPAARKRLEGAVRGFKRGTIRPVRPASMVS